MGMLGRCRPKKGFDLSRTAFHRSRAISSPPYYLGIKMSYLVALHTSRGGQWRKNNKLAIYIRIAERKEKPRKGVRSLFEN
eukprot:scaffold2168_cov180-Amphora_coffeaeformis.AAC.5